MKLYYATNTVAVAAAVALNEAGLAHELIKIDAANGEQTKSTYLGINSKGRVPALAVGDAILTETGAILDYIASQSSTASLSPKDPWDHARMQSVMFYLASTMHVAHAHKMRGSRWADQDTSFADMAAKVPQTMTACATYVETECLTGPFISGDTVTIGDCYLYAVCSWLVGDGVDMTKQPKINAFLSAMEARDSVKTARKAGVIA
jgi:glutathione S-transferase